MSKVVKCQGCDGIIPSNRPIFDLNDLPYCQGCFINMVLDDMEDSNANDCQLVVEVNSFFWFDKKQVDHFYATDVSPVVVNYYRRCADDGFPF